MPCDAYVDEVATGWINFEAHYVLAEGIACRIYAEIANVEVMFPNGAPQPDACLDMTVTPGLPGEGQCPVYPGESFLYNISLPILDSYPRQPITGRWTLWTQNPDQEETLLLCVEVDVNIKERP